MYYDVSSLMTFLNILCKKIDATHCDEDSVWITVFQESEDTFMNIHILWIILASNYIKNEIIVIICKYLGLQGLSLFNFEYKYRYLPLLYDATFTFGLQVVMS